MAGDTGLFAAAAATAAATAVAAASISGLIRVRQSRRSAGDIPIIDVSPLLFRSIVATASSSSSLSKDDEDDTVEKNRIDFLFVEVFRRTRKEHDAQEVVVVHDVVLILYACSSLPDEDKTNRATKRSFFSPFKERTNNSSLLCCLSAAF